MRYQQFGARYVVRLESGERVVETLSKFLDARGIGFAEISAAGALQSLTLGYWNADSHKYQFRDFDEQVEAVSFQGNASLKDGKAFLHVHGVFGRSDYSTIAGHITEASVHPTFEVWLRTEELAIRREHDDTTGLDLLALDTAAEHHDAQRVRSDVQDPSSIKLTS